MLNIDKILKLENINNYILSLGIKQREMILKNNEIRDYYLKYQNDNKFISLVSNLSKNELSNFIDNDMIDKILKNKDFYRIISQLIYIYSLNKHLENIFVNDKIINVLIHDFHLKFYISYLNGTITNKIFNQIIECNEIEKLIYLNEDDFCKLVEKQEVVNKIKLINDYNIITKLPIKVLNKLLIDPYFKSKLLSMKIEDIDCLIKNGLILPNVFLNDKDFINKYIDVNNVALRRIYVKSLVVNNYSIYEVVNNNLKFIYDTSTFDELIKEYNMILKESADVKLKQQIMTIYSNRFLQLLIDRYFEDVVNNVITNIFTILAFNRQYEIIPENRLKYYNMIKNFNSFSFDEKRKIYSYMPEDISTWLYEDFRKCQNKAYELINNLNINVSKLKSKKMDEIIVYELNGEEFILPVHAMINRRSESNIKWKKSINIKTLSLTLIGNENLGTYREPNEYLVVGFKKINIDSIMHVYHSDSFSSNERSTDRINEIYSPHELLRKTQGYNEILVLQQNANSQLIPDYVVCYDEVTSDDIRCAKSLGNLPIILINTKYYSMKPCRIDYEENIYVRSAYDLLHIYDSQKSKK